MANARETTQSAQKLRAAEKSPQSSPQSKLDRVLPPGLEGLNGPLGGPTSPFYGGTVESQAKLVARSNTAQQQTTLSDIGLVQGNRHLQRVVSRVQLKPSEEALSNEPYTLEDGAESTQVMTAPLRGAISRVAFSSFMPKLSVSQPGDPYELEADSVADQVMKMPQTSAPAPEKDTAKGESGTSDEQTVAPKVSRALNISGVSRSLGDSALRTHAPHPITHSPALQRLTVSEPGDAYEVEADQVADQVMKLPASATPPPPAAGDNGDDDTNNAGKNSLNRAVQLQADGGNRDVDAGVEQDVNSLKGLGQPMPDGEREFFESRMGYDFGNVRLHTDGKAVQTARNLNARAYAVGTDIAFGQGEYAPGTTEGRRLMAHELTHVVQQGGAGLKEAPEQPAASAPEVEPDLAARETIARELDSFSMRDLIQNKMEEAREKARAMESGWRMRVSRLVQALQAQKRKNPIPDMNQMREQSAQFRDKVRLVVTEAAGHMWKEYKFKVTLPIIAEVAAQAKSSDGSVPLSANDMKIKPGDYPEYEAMLDPIGEKAILEALRQAFRKTDLEKEVGTLIKVPKEEAAPSAAAEEGGSGGAQAGAGSGASSEQKEGATGAASEENHADGAQGDAAQAAAGQEAGAEPASAGQAGAEQAAGAQAGAQDAPAQEASGAPGPAPDGAQAGEEAGAQAQPGQDGAAANAAEAAAETQWNDDKLPKPEEFRKQSLPEARQTFGESVVEMDVAKQTFSDALTGAMGQFDATAGQPEADSYRQVAEMARAQAAAETAAAEMQVQQENTARTEALHSALQPAEAVPSAAEMPKEAELAAPEQAEPAVEGEYSDGAQPNIDEQAKRAEADKVRADVDLKARREATEGIADSLGAPMPDPQKPATNTGQLDAEKQKMSEQGKDMGKSDQDDGQIAELPVDEPVFEPQTPSPMMVFRKADGAGASLALGAETEGQIAQLQTSGAPLPKNEKAFFQRRMGRDLSDVRIHTGGEAAQLNRALQSEAFTVGNHIAFAQGKYQPGSAQGRRLMAHELAHVGQGGPQLKGFGFNIFAWIKRILKLVQAVVNSESALLGVLQVLKSMALDMLERIKTKLLDALMTGNINAINMQMITDEMTVENLEQSFDAAVQQQAQQNEAEVKAESEAKAAETEAQSASDVAALEAEKQEKEAELKADEQAAESEMTTEAQTKEEELRASEAEAEAEMQTQHEQAEAESQAKVEEAESQIESDVKVLQQDAETLQSDTDEKAQERQAEAQEKLDNVKQQAEEKFAPEAVSKQINLDARIEGAINVPPDQFAAYKERVYQEITQEARQLWNDFKTSVMDTTAQDIQASFQDLQTAATDAWKALQEQGKTLMTTAQGMIKDVQDQIKGIWNSVTENALKLKGDLKQMAEQAWSDLKGKATEMWNTLKTKATEVWNNLKTKATELWDNLKNKATEFWNSVKNLFTGGLDGLKSLGTQLLGNLKDTVKNALAQLKQQALDALKKLAQDIAKKLAEQITKNVASAVAQTGASVAATATTAAKGAPITPFAFPAVMRMIAQTIMAGVKNLAELAKNALKSLTKMVENGKKFVSNLLETGKKATGSLQGFGNKMLGALKTQATNAWNWVKEQGTNALDNLAKRAQTAIDNLSKLGENAWNTLKSYGENAWNNLKGFGEKAWNSLKDFGGNLQGLLDKGWTKVKDLWANRQQLFKTGIDKVLTWGKNIAVEQITGLLGKEAREIYDIYTTAVKPRVDKALTSIGESKVLDFVESLFDSARGGSSGGKVQAKLKPGATVARMVYRTVDADAAAQPAAATATEAPTDTPASEAASAGAETEAQTSAAGGEARKDQALAAESESQEAKASAEASSEDAEKVSEEEAQAAEGEKEAGEEEKVAGAEEEKAAPGEEEAADGEKEEAKAKEEAGAQGQSMLDAPMEPELEEEKVPQILEEAAGMNASQLSNRENKMWSRISGMVNQMVAQDKQTIAQQATGSVQRAAAEGDVMGGSQVPGAVESQIGALQGGGEPLPDEDRAFFEQRMGADFSGVRVHTGGTAEATSQGLQARAYTVGSDIAFNQGEYQPGTPDGRRLLAHELTHVVQQGGAGELQRQPEDGVAAGVAPTEAAGQVQRAAEAGAGGGSGGSQAASTFETFVTGTATELVKGYDGIGEQITGDLSADAAAVAAEAVPLPVDMKSAGEIEDQDAAGTDAAGADIANDVTGANPAPLQATPHENAGEAPDNTAEADQLSGGGGLLGWFSSLFNRFKEALTGIRTKDEGVNTASSDDPQFEAAGDSDPARAERQAEQGEQQVDNRQDTVAQEMTDAPGDELVQPQDLHEEAPVEMQEAETPAPQMEPTVEMQEYAAMDVPENVRQSADEVLKPKLAASLAGPQSAVEAAVAERDSAKAQAFADAQEAVDKQKADADAAQAAEVESYQEEVAKKKEESIKETEKVQEEFKSEVDKEETTVTADVDNRIVEDQKQADAAIADGEKKAEDEKVKAEEAARKKKEEAEKESKEKSWWDRATDAVKSAIKAVSEVVDKIFEAVRETVKTIIDTAKKAAIDLIEAGRKWVVGKLDGFRTWVKDKVDKYLSERFPALAEALNTAIDAAADLAIDAVNKVADGLKTAVTAIADTLGGALDALLNVFQSLVQAQLGLITALVTGDFLEAARFIFEAALKALGLPVDQIMGILNKSGEAIKQIFSDPIGFLGNLVNGVKLGFNNFIANILTHLQNGFIAWLTGSLGEIGITLPEKFDLKGIFQLAMQILGVSMDQIKGKVTKLLGFDIFGLIDQIKQIWEIYKEGGVPALAEYGLGQLIGEGQADAIFDLIEAIQAIIAGDWGKVWELIQENLAMLEELVIGKIKEFLVENVIKAGVTWIISLLNPAGAIVRAVKGIYDIVMFFIERGQQIMALVSAVTDSIAALASGDISGAASAVEQALAKGIPVAIGFLSSLLGITGITAKIKSVIESVREAVDKALDAVFNFGPIKAVGDFIRGIVDKIKGGLKKILKFLFPEKQFSIGKESHTLSLKAQGTGAPVVYMASGNPQPLLDKLDAAQSDSKIPADAKRDIPAAKSLVEEIQTLGEQGDKETDAAKQDAIKADINAKYNTLVPMLVKILGVSDALTGEAKRKYDQVMSDSAIPSGVKKSFETEVEAKLLSAPDPGADQVQLLKDVVSGGDFLAKGPEIPAGELETKGGMTRAVPLETIWKDNLPADYKKKYRTFERWLSAIVGDKSIFNPSTHLSRSSTIPGKYATAWWAPRNQQKGNTMAELIVELSLDPGAYAGGCVRVTIGPDAAKMAGFKKPTALDGIFNSEFVTAPGKIWGVTAGGSLEAIAPKISLSEATQLEYMEGDMSRAEIIPDMPVAEGDEIRYRPVGGPGHRWGDATVTKVDAMADEIVLDITDPKYKTGLKKGPLTLHGADIIGKMGETWKPSSGVDDQINDITEALNAVGGLMEFMKGMAKSSSAGGMTLEEFTDLWGISEIRQLLAGRLRALKLGNHEWLPGEIINKVIDKAAIDFANQGQKWIDLQNKLRTPTDWIIFEPDRWTQETFEDEFGDKETVYVPQGHSGALYKDGKPLTVGQPEFHQAIIGVFTGSSTVEQYKTSLVAKIEEWVWKDDQPVKTPIHPLVTYNGKRVEDDPEDFADKYKSSSSTMIKTIEATIDGVFA